MEAFKAANPGCTLGDFVRWYSPRDWVETEVLDADGNVTGKYQLSQRMQIPGNHILRPVYIKYTMSFNSIDYMQYMYRTDASISRTRV